MPLESAPLSETVGGTEPRGEEGDEKCNAVELEGIVVDNTWSNSGVNWTRLSCHRLVANQVRLQLFVLAYNLGDFLRRLGLPKAIKNWALRSLQVKLIKMRGRIVRQRLSRLSSNWLKWLCPERCLLPSWSG